MQGDEIEGVVCVCVVRREERGCCQVGTGKVEKSRGGFFREDARAGPSPSTTSGIPQHHRVDSGTPETSLVWPGKNENTMLVRLGKSEKTMQWDPQGLRIHVSVKNPRQVTKQTSRRGTNSRPSRTVCAHRQLFKSLADGHGVGLAIA